MTIQKWLIAFGLICISAPCSAQPPALGAYVSNNRHDVAEFQAWLGRAVDHLPAHTDRANWSDWVSSIRWQRDLWQPLNKPITWTIPLFAKNGTLHEGAIGTYRNYYDQAARIIATSRLSDPVIYIRSGEELNGNWEPWSAEGHTQEFVGAYRQFVDAFRSVSSRFRFEWNVNVGENRMKAEDAYPGDEYVDVMGMDFYYDLKWDPADPAAAWNKMLCRPYGLQWFERFANSRHKPTAYPEWGVNSDGAGPYIANLRKWFDSHDVLYQAVWDSNEDFQGKLSNGQYPKAAAAYIATFGAQATEPLREVAPEQH